MAELTLTAHSATTISSGTVVEAGNIAGKRKND